MKYIFRGSLELVTGGVFSIDGVILDLHFTCSYCEITGGGIAGLYSLRVSASATGQGEIVPLKIKGSHSSCSYVMVTGFRILVYIVTTRPVSANHALLYHALNYPLGDFFEVTASTLSRRHCINLLEMGFGSFQRRIDFLSTR